VDTESSRAIRSTENRVPCGAVVPSVSANSSGPAYFTIRANRVDSSASRQSTPKLYQELVVPLQLRDLPAQSQQLGPFGRLQGLLTVDLGSGDPAPLVFDPDAQHPRVDPSSRATSLIVRPESSTRCAASTLYSAVYDRRLRGGMMDILPAGPQSC
jgi:hypothetical protein